MAPKDIRRAAAILVTAFSCALGGAMASRSLPLSLPGAPESILRIRTYRLETDEALYERYGVTHSDGPYDVYEFDCQPDAEGVDMLSFAIIRHRGHALSPAFGGMKMPNYHSIVVLSEDTAMFFGAFNFLHHFNSQTAEEQRVLLRGQTPWEAQQGLYTASTTEANRAIIKVICEALTEAYQRDYIPRSYRG